MLSANTSFLGLLVLWAGLSALWAEVPSKSFKSATLLTTLVVGFGLSRLVVRHPGSVRLFMMLSLVAGGLAATYGILQHHLDSGFFAMPLDGNGIKDPSSTFGLSNFSVDVLVMILPLGLGLSLAYGGKLNGLIGGLCFLTISYYVAISQVRTGYMSFLVMVGFFALVAFFFRKETVFVHRHRVLLALAGSLLLGGLFLGLTRPGKHTVTSFISSFDLQHPTIMLRLHTWQQAIRMIGEHPLIGVGLGNYTVASWKFQDQDMERIAIDSNTRMDRAHNEYLHLSCELGLLGLILFLLFLGSLIVNSLRFLSGSQEASQFWIVLALTTGLVGELVSATFTFPFQMPGSIHQFSLTAGALSGLVTTTGPRKKKVNQVTRTLNLLKYPGLIAVFAAVSISLMWSIRFTLAETAYRDGQYLKDEGLYHQALALYDEGISYEPFAERIHYEKAHVLARLGRLSAAADSMVECLTRTPYFGRGRKEYAMLLSDLGQVDAALRESSIALETDRLEACEIHLQRASYCLRSFDFHQALSELFASLASPGTRDPGAANLRNLENSLIWVETVLENRSLEDQRGEGLAPTFEQGHGGVETIYKDALDQLQGAEGTLAPKALYWYVRALFEIRSGLTERARVSLAESLKLDARADGWTRSSSELKRLLATGE